MSSSRSRQERGSDSGESQKPRRVSDVTDASVEPKNVQEVLGEDVEILSFIETQGDKGKYLLIDVKLANGEKAVIRTGAANVMRKMRQLERDGNFPIIGTFFEEGRMYDLR